jgi:hypothetical protein
MFDKEGVATLEVTSGYNDSENPRQDEKVRCGSFVTNRDQTIQYVAKIDYVTR